MLNFQTQPIAETKHSELFFFTWFRFYNDVNDQHPKWIQKPGSVSLNHLLLLCVFVLIHPMRIQTFTAIAGKAWQCFVSCYCWSTAISQGDFQRMSGEEVLGNPHAWNDTVYRKKKSSMLLLMGKRYFFSFNFTLHKYFSCAFSFAEYPPRSEYVPLSAPTQKTKLCTSQARTLTLPTYNFQSKPTLCEESCITKELK